MATAAEGLTDLIDSMGLAGSAAGDLEEILDQQRSALAGYASALETTAAKVAAATAKTSAASDKALMADNLARMKFQDDNAAAQKKAGEEAQETSKWFSDLSAAGGEQTSTLELLGGAWEAYGGYVKQAGAAVEWVAGKLYDLMATAVALTQEKDALRATFDVFTGGAGDELLGGLEDLAAQLPFTGDALNAWAKKLLAAGISGDALKSAISAIAASTAIMGQAGAQATEGLIKRFAMMAEAGQKVKLDRRILTQLAEAGVSVQALAKALGKTPEELGKVEIAAGDLSAAMQNALIKNGSKALGIMANTWSSISAKLSEGWDDAFEDLGDLVGPFMGQLRSLASEFFAGSTAGGVFKDVIHGVLAPAFEVATRSARALHIAYLNVLIAFLKAKIFLAPVIDALSGIGVSGAIVNVTMYLIAGTAIILAVALGLVALAMFLVLSPFILAGVVIYLVGVGIMKLVGLFSDAAGSFDSLSAKVSESTSSILASIISTVSAAASYLLGLPVAAATAGANFALGLVQGILTGQGPVADAVKALARSAIGAIVGAFQTKSPSRVTDKIGGYFDEGLEGGIREGEGDVADAAQGVGDAAVGGLGKGMSRGKGKGGKAGGGGPTFIFKDCTFGASSQEDVNDMMNAWWETLDASGPEPEPA